MRLPPPIDSVRQIMEKTHLLEVLKEIHSTQQLINHIFSSRKKDTLINPLDMFHEFLKVDIDVVLRESEDFKSIDKAVQNTHGPTHKAYTLTI